MRNTADARRRREPRRIEVLARQVHHPSGQPAFITVPARRMHRCAASPAPASIHCPGCSRRSGRRWRRHMKDLQIVEQRGAPR